MSDTNIPRPGDGNQPPQGTSGGQGTASSAAGAARGFTERARTTAIETSEEARDKARRGLQQGRDKIAERIERLGSALRASTGELENDEFVSRYAESAAERVERLASYLRSTDLRDAVHDVEDLARRYPLAFFGGAFAIGLTAGRFLRSSASRSSVEPSGTQTPPRRAAMPQQSATTSPGLGDTLPGFGQRPTTAQQPQPPRPTVPQPARPPAGQGPKFS